MVIASPNTDLLLQVPINKDGFIDCHRSYRMKSNICQQIHRTGSNVAVNVAVRPIVNGGARTSSWRDKLCKFKDASFLRNLSGSSSSKLDSLSEHTINSIHTVETVAKRQVRFSKNSENKIYEIEPLSMLTKDEIWWTMDELVAFRAAGQVELLGDRAIQKYVSDFDQAKREVFTNRKLSSECMRELVTGLSKGFLGLEALLRCNQRTESIRDYVVSVVRFFRESSRGEGTIHLNDSIGSFGSQNSYSISNLNLSVRDQNVRKYAANLSAGNRHFARAMGNAEYLAAIRDTDYSRRN